MRREPQFWRAKAPFWRAFWRQRGLFAGPAALQEALLAVFVAIGLSTLLTDSTDRVDEIRHNVLVRSAALADPLCYVIRSATGERSIDR